MRKRLSRHEYLVRARELAPRGEQLPHTKLNPEKVRYIRSCQKREVTSKQLAAKFNVHPRTIESVRSYRTWYHIR